MPQHNISRSWLRSLTCGLMFVVLKLPVQSQEIPAPGMDEGTIASGHLEVSPIFGIAGQFGTWTVTYTVGDRDIQEGGGIRVQLPDAWHSGPRNSANRLQSSDPQAEHYVTSRTSRANIELQTIVEGETPNLLVKHSKPSLDGRSHRYVFVVRVVVKRGALLSGDTITVTYGDRTGGSVGYRASAVSTRPMPILAAVDWDGDNRFQLLADHPTLEARPGSAVEMMLDLPSQAVAGQPLHGLISLVDAEANPIEHSAQIQLYAHSGEASFPETVQVMPHKGYAEIEIIPKANGVLRLRARSKVYELEAHSNPVLVTSEPEAESTYWGDLHSHTHFSWDGVGDDHYNYARYISGLDFYAMTDHATEGLEKQYQEEYIQLPDRYNDPPRFVTLHAYEMSFGNPYGHHNIFFRDAPGPLMLPGKVSLPEVWKSLRKGQALTIPHHTGKFPDGIQFTPDDPEFRRNFEIYSAHGLSEAFDPFHPLAFERSLFTGDAKSVENPSYAQDAWKMGMMLSTIASSDDHRAHPGQPHYGLVAVRAPELTREAVFQALYNRRTYGTTGGKIILDFTLNGRSMGECVTVDGTPQLAVAAIGTDRIANVEVLRYRPHDPQFTVIQRWTPESSEFRGEFQDRDYQPGSIYYVRLQQSNTIRNRAVMAWSSPIWTNQNER